MCGTGRLRRDTREAVLHLTKAIQGLTDALQQLKAAQEQFNQIHQETLENWLEGHTPSFLPSEDC